MNLRLRYVAWKPIMSMINEFRYGFTSNHERISIQPRKGNNVIMSNGEEMVRKCSDISYRVSHSFLSFSLTTPRSSRLVLVSMGHYVSYHEIIIAFSSPFLHQPQFLTAILIVLLSVRYFCDISNIKTNVCSFKCYIVSKNCSNMYLTAKFLSHLWIIQYRRYPIC